MPANGAYAAFKARESVLRRIRSRIFQKYIRIRSRVCENFEAWAFYMFEARTMPASLK